MSATTVTQTRTTFATTWRSIPGIAKFAAFVLALSVIPFYFDNLYLRDIFSFIGLYIILGMGMNVVVGYAGLLDLGYIAFYGIAAYTIAFITAKAAIAPFWVAFPVAIVLATGFGVLLGFPTLRLRPDYLAMVTLGFGEIVRLSFLNLEPITGGPSGIVGIPRPDLGILKLKDANQLYWFIAVMAVLVTYIVMRLGDSRIGRAWAFTRQDETAAEAAGIDTVRMKLLAFAIGAGVAGLAGALFATELTIVAPESFTWWESLLVLIVVVMGGMGSIPGVVVGAIVMVSLPELLRDFSDYRFLILGIGLILLALFRPQGLWPARAQRFSLRGGLAHDGAPATDPLDLRIPPVGAGVPPVDAGTPLLEATALSKRFGGLAALTDVDLQIRQGEIVSLIGPNGAGKTTFLNVIAGVYPPSSGQVRFAGTSLSHLRPNRIAALGIGRTFQNTRLFRDLSVLENVTAGLHCRTRAGALQTVLLTPGERAEERQIWAQSMDILRSVGLAQSADSLARNLPYGDQRRVEIARALASSPRLLVLDEPAAGLSAQERLDLMALIRSLRAAGVTVLLIEHDMDFVMSISDRVVVLNYGKLIAQGTPEQVQNDTQVIEAYLGTDEED